MTNAKKTFDISQADIENALMRGSGFAGGKCRIYCMFTHDHTPKEAAAFLREEYGVGGYSHDWLDGTRGFVDFTHEGMKFSRKGFTEEIALKWDKIERYIRGMVERGAYLTEKEKTYLNDIIEACGFMPDPIPRCGFPRCVTFDEFVDMIPDTISLDELSAMIPAT